MKEDKTQVIQRMIDVFDGFRKVQKPLFSSVGIRHTEFHALKIIFKLTRENQSGIKVLDIAREMEIAPPSVTLLVNDLVQEGYAERKTNEEDRRSVQIRLTAKGEELLEQCRQTMHSRLEGIVDYLGIEKSDQLSDLLAEICQYFKEQDEVSRPEDPMNRRH